MSKVNTAPGLRSGKARRGAEMRAERRASNAYCWGVPQAKATDLHVRYVRGSERSAYFGMNYE